MIKKILLVFCLTMPSLGVADTWEPLAETSEGGVYFAPDSMYHDDLDRVVFWMKYNKLQPKAGEYAMQKMLVIVDCDKKSIATPEIKSYNKQGVLVDDFSTNPLTVPPISPDPDSFFYKVVQSLCKSNSSS